MGGSVVPWKETEVLLETEGGGDDWEWRAEDLHFSVPVQEEEFQGLNEIISLEADLCL